MFVVSLEIENANEGAQLMALIELHSGHDVTELDSLPMLDAVDRLLDNLRTWAHYAPEAQGWGRDDVGMVQLRLEYLASNLTKAKDEMEANP